MKILIVGCGNVGAALAEQLSSEGHDITVIDTRSWSKAYPYRAMRLELSETAPASRYSQKRVWMRQI